MYVQYGCGFSAPSGWHNFDASPTLRVERAPLLGRFVKRNAQRFPARVQHGDIAQGLLVPDGSCEGVYASHVLEHLSLDDMRTALRNTHRMLKPGGYFRLVVPDLETLARQYLDSKEPDAALRFMRESCLGSERRPRTIKDHVVSSLGNSRHQWMWDWKSMRVELETAGFTAIRQCKPGDAADPLFLEVEDPGRFADAVAIECRKP